MGNKVVIFGAADMAMLSHYYLVHDSPYEVEAFTVDREFLKVRMLCGLPVVPFEDIESTYPPGEYKMLVAIMFGGLNKPKMHKYLQAKAKGYELVSYVSSKAITWSDLVIGDNSFICEGSVIGPFAEIGSNVFISPGSLIGHNSIVKDHCFIGSHAVVLGWVTIEQYSFIGANSTIRDGITVASKNIIGAGATITKSTKEKAVYVERPAQLLPKSSDVLKAWLTWPVR